MASGVEEVPEEERMYAGGCWLVLWGSWVVVDWRIEGGSVEGSDL